MNLDMIKGRTCEVNIMQTANVKEVAHQLIDQLPDDVSWDQLAYHMETRASIERGLEDVRAGRTYTTDEVRKHLGLDD